MYFYMLMDYAVQKHIHYHKYTISIKSCRRLLYKYPLSLGAHVSTHRPISLIKYDFHIYLHATKIRFAVNPCMTYYFLHILRYSYQINFFSSYYNIRWMSGNIHFHRYGITMTDLLVKGAFGLQLGIRTSLYVIHEVMGGNSPSWKSST